jgi:hypothetical protein
VRACTHCGNGCFVFLYEYVHMRVVVISAHFACKSCYKSRLAFLRPSKYIQIYMHACIHIHNSHVLPPSSHQNTHSEYVHTCVFVVYAHFARKSCCKSRLTSLRPSKYAFCSVSCAVNLFVGSMTNKPFMKLNAFFVSFPTYRFSSVSGLDMSGNFRPRKRGLRRNMSVCVCMRMYLFSRAQETRIAQGHVRMCMSAYVSI